jgi:bifunctional DNA-binding transcriptional regulator/antitoxin component of YhaV-PrlF toxin-antitoxin module
LEVRKKLGIGPGSTIEWEEEAGKIVVRRAGRFTSEDIHQAVFPDAPPTPHTLAEMKDGIRGYIRKRHSTNAK